MFPLRAGGCAPAALQYAHVLRDPGKPRIVRGVRNCNWAEVHCPDQCFLHVVTQVWGGEKTVWMLVPCVIGLRSTVRRPDSHTLDLPPTLACSPPHALLCRLSFVAAPMAIAPLPVASPPHTPYCAA